MTHVGRGPTMAPGRRGAGKGPPRPVILFVSPVADLKGGAERVLLDLFANPAISPALAVPGEGELAELARSRGYPLRFFDLGAVAGVRRPPRPADLAGAARGGLRCARQLAQAARETGAALIHTNGLKAHVIGGLTRRLYGVPALAHVHDIPHTRLERAIWAGIAKAVTRMAVVSAPCYPGALPRNVAVVANGVRAPAAPAAARSLPATPTIGFVGRFHPFKGVDLLLDWFERASAGRPDLRLLIRGRADEEGAAYWQGLEGRIVKLVEDGRCRVLGWAGAGEDPYAGIDILAAPSRTPDPSPLVVLEAMLRGIPVIGYPAGGIPALIGGPETGRLAATPEAFDSALAGLLKPETYAAVSAASAARVRESFTVERFWDAVNAQYRLVGAAAEAPGQR